MRFVFYITYEFSINSQKIVFEVHINYTATVQIRIKSADKYQHTPPIPNFIKICVMLSKIEYNDKHKTTSCLQFYLHFVLKIHLWVFGLFPETKEAWT